MPAPAPEREEITPLPQRAAAYPQPKGSVMQQLVTMTDRRAALAKRLDLQAPSGEANAHDTLPAAE
jgi:hypothetical protein